jgi:hypothetical protein
VLVVVRGPASSPQVLTRQRVELVRSPLPRQPYHAIAEGGLSLRDGESLISRVKEMSTTAAIAATATVVKEYSVGVIGVVGHIRNIPDDLGRILASHALLHAAEGALFEEALLDAADQVGLGSLLVESKAIKISHGVETAGKSLGPPWQKDHKFAAAAALAALSR